MNVFPAELLRPEYSVLCLFAAHYTGEHDVAFVKEAGCTNVLLIDNNKEKLDATCAMYGYKGKCCDAFDFITISEAAEMKWDVVIADQWSNQDVDVNVEFYHWLKSICREHLILGYGPRQFDGKFIEPGRYLHRSDHLGGVYWRIVDL